MGPALCEGFGMLRLFGLRLLTGIEMIAFGRFERMRGRVSGWSCVERCRDWCCGVF